MARIISPEQANEIEARLVPLNAWINSRSGNSWTETEREMAKIANVTNEERSALECFLFCYDPPAKYFAYVSGEAPLQTGCGTEYGRACKVTTWTGEVLGNATLGPVYRDNFGGKRRSISLRAINGQRYSGTYYTSAGDYCRLRAVKS